MSSSLAPARKRSRNRSLTTFLMLVCLVLAVVLGAGFWWHQKQLGLRDASISTLERKIETLEGDKKKFDEERMVLLDQVNAVQNEIAQAQEKSQALQKALDDKQREIEETMVPREISSPADFPIERAMARNGDTPEAFAKRENTDLDVLRALNPWLKTDQTLKSYQLLWLPRKTGKTANK